MAELLQPQRLMRSMVDIIKARPANLDNRQKLERLNAFITAHGKSKPHPLNVGVVYVPENGFSQKPGLMLSDYAASSADIAYVLSERGIRAQAIPFDDYIWYSLSNSGVNLAFLNSPLTHPRKPLQELIRHLEGEYGIPCIAHPESVYDLALTRSSARERLKEAKLGHAIPRFVAIPKGEHIEVGGKPTSLTPPLILRPDRRSEGIHLVFNTGTVVAPSGDAYLVEEFCSGPEFFVLTGSNFYTRNVKAEFSYNDEAFTLPLLPETQGTMKPTVAIPTKDLQGKLVFEIASGEKAADRLKPIPIEYTGAREILNLAKGIYGAFGCTSILGVSIRLRQSGGPAFIDMAPSIDMSKPEAKKGNLLSVFLSEDTGRYSTMVYDIFLNGVIHILDRLERSG